MMSDAGTFAFIDGKLVQLSPPALMAKLDGKKNYPLSKSEGIGGSPFTTLHNLVPLATPVSTNPDIVSFTMTPNIPLGAVLSIPWVPGSPAVNLHGQPQVPNMAGLIQSNLSSPIQSNVSIQIQPDLTSNIQSNLTKNIHPNLTSTIQSNLTSNIQTAPTFHQNVVQPSVHRVLSTVPIIQPSMSSVMPTVPNVQEGIQQNVAVAPQGVSMVVQNFPSILSQMPSMINQGTINIVHQSPSNVTQAVPSIQQQSVETQSSVRQIPSPAGPVISSVQSLSEPHISGKQFIYSPNNDCIGVMETFDSNPQLGPVGAKKPGNRWRTPTPPNMLSKSSNQWRTPTPPNMLSKTRTPVRIEPKVTNNDKKHSDLELMSSDQKHNSCTPVPQTLFKRVMKTTGEPAVICINLQEKQMNLVELRHVTDENMSDKQVTDFSHFNVRRSSDTKTSQCQQQLAQPKTSLSNKTVSHQPVAVASSHIASNTCVARTNTSRQSKTKSTLCVVPQLDKLKQTGSSSQVLQQASIPLNVFPNLGNQNKNLTISSQSAQKLNAKLVQQENTEKRLPNYWGGPNRVIHVTSANTSTSIPFSTVSQVGVDIINQYLISPSSVAQVSSVSKMGQDLINPSIQATEGNKTVLTSLLSENQYMLCTSSGTQVSAASKGGQIIVNPASILVNPSALVNQSSTLGSQSSYSHSSLQGTQVGQILMKPVSAKQEFTMSTGVAKKQACNHSLSTGMAFGTDNIISTQGVSSIQSSTLASNPKTLANNSASRAGHQKEGTASESLFTNVAMRWKKDAKTGTMLKSPSVETVSQKIATSTAPVIIPCANFTCEAPCKAPSLTADKIQLTAQVSQKTDDVIDLTEDTSSAEICGMITRVSATVKSGNKESIVNCSSDKQKAKMLSTSSSNCTTKSATEIFVDLTAEDENSQEVENGENNFTGDSSQLLNKIAEKGTINIDSGNKQSQKKCGVPKTYIEVDLTGPSSPDQSAVFKEIYSNNQSETETSIYIQSEDLSNPSSLVELNDSSGIFAKRVENLTLCSDESTDKLDSAGENSSKSDLDPSNCKPVQLNLIQYYLPQPNVKKDMAVQNKAERSFNDCFLSFCSRQEQESSDPKTSENDLPVQKHQVKEKITDSFIKERSKRSDRTARSRKRFGKRSGEEKNSGPRSKRSNRKKLGRSTSYYKYSFCSDTSESEGNYSEYSDSECMTEIYVDVDTNNDKDDIDSKDVLDSVRILQSNQEAGNSLRSLPVQFCRVVLTRIDDLETHNGLLDPDKLCSKKCREAHVKTLC
ncbi:hypothetical protein CHS0354_031331 [Potamilus streckersoni]|nr:hypothetical protein CHS0354_031331 [Potamilus streckersoni]